MKLKFANALSLALIVAMLFTSAALADNVVNNVVSTPASITLQAGDSSSFVDVQFWIQPNSSDGDPQCNFDSLSESVTFAINTPSEVMANPGSLTFNKCKDGGNNNAQTVRFSASSLAASGNISFTQTANNSGGSFVYADAVFFINVAAPPPSDTTTPIITPNVSGTLGFEGWYTSDVTVSWTVTDNESAISSSNGCDPTTISTDMAGTTLTCSATSAGGNASNSVTIKRDATAPLISFQGPPISVWYRENVTAIWSCEDATSGAAFDTVSAFVINQGSAVPAVGRCVDKAGNSAFDTQLFKIDQTAPTITGAPDRAANDNGWYNNDVTVTFTCSDAVSGIAFCSDPSQLGEGEDQSVTGTATDNAGNNNSTTVSGINIDKTAPTASATASPAANGFGWNNSDVTVSFSGSDSLSGIASCSDPVPFSGEGANQPASGTCTDNADNVSAPATASVSIDKTAPSVSLVGGPANGGTYYFGFVPPAPTCSASDALSGPDGSCSVSVYGTTVGSHTVTASATDKAGNSASASATYEVIAWTLNGFYQPVDMGSNTWNTVKNGSTVPFKFELFAGSTELKLTSYVTGFTAQAVQCPSGSFLTDAIEVTATGNTSLRFDTTGDQFIYNWQTPKLPGRCYVITMTAQDGSTISAKFILK